MGSTSPAHSNNYFDLGLRDPSLLPISSFIDNKASISTSPDTLRILNPSTDDPLLTLPQATSNDIQHAIHSATKAQVLWHDTPLSKRLALLQSWVQNIRNAKEDIARIITLENGKPYDQALGEVDYAAGFFDWNTQEVLHSVQTSTTDISPSTRTIVTKSPVGVVFAITPWNFPLAMLARKVAPAVAVGCSIIAKPSELTPLAALMLAELGRRAGAPDGLLNVLVTEKAQETLDQILSAPSVQMVSFTGSTRVGKIIGERAAQRVLRVGLELGGHAPFLVFNDCDVRSAVEGLLKNKLRNSGQSCVCANRVYVQSGAYDTFIELMLTQLKNLKLGHGFDSVDVGPLICRKAVEKIVAQITDAKMHGARCLHGGSAKGNFIDPTLLIDVTDDMMIANEETFGPVIGVIKFEDEDEVWQKANRTQAGLAAYVYTKDIGKAMRGIRGLSYGMIGVNGVGLSAAATSFGGMRESGLGREGGLDSLEAYLETKFATIEF